MIGSQKSIAELKALYPSGQLSCGDLVVPSVMLTKIAPLVWVHSRYAIRFKIG